MTTVNLNKDFFETCGTNSLEGALAAAGIMEPQTVKLRFRQTSYAWRQQNGGPDLYIVPEFVPLCLIDSVLRLSARGFKLETEFYTD